MKTRENYFYKLVNYMKSVYNTEHGLNKLEDGRVNPTYTTAQVVNRTRTKVCEILNEIS